LRTHTILIDIITYVSIQKEFGKFENWNTLNGHNSANVPCWYHAYSTSAVSFQGFSGSDEWKHPEQNHPSSRAIIHRSSWTMLRHRPKAEAIYIIELIMAMRLPSRKVVCFKYDRVVWPCYWLLSTSWAPHVTLELSLDTWRRRRWGYPANTTSPRTIWWDEGTVDLYWRWIMDGYSSSPPTGSGTHTCAPAPIPACFRRTDRIEIITHQHHTRMDGWVERTSSHDATMLRADHAGPRRCGACTYTTMYTVWRH
jgi:hypothetical protein